MTNRYRSYKPSGVDWLGDIPIHWEVRRLKTLLAQNDGGVWGDEADGNGTIVLRSTEQTIYGGWEIVNPAMRSLTSNEKTNSVLKVGDLVVTKSSGSAMHIGKTSLVTDRVAELNPCFSNFIQRLRCRPELEPRLAWYLLNSPVGRRQLILKSNSTTGLANLSGSMLGELFIPFSPSMAEQRAIADYLDAETARIDTLISKKRRLIDLLQERWDVWVRNQLASLPNPARPLKRHWRVIDCKHRTPTYVEEGYPVVSPGDATPGRLDLRRAHRFVDESDYDDLASGFRQPKRGDIVYSRNASIGIASYVDTDEPFCMGQDVCLIQSNDMDQLFLMYALNSIGLDQLETQKIGSTFDRVNISQILEIRVPVPDPSEQQKLGRRFDLAASRRSRAQGTLEQQIDLLQEYRTTLITAAVTGQVSVEA